MTFGCQHKFSVFTKSLERFHALLSYVDPISVSERSQGLGKRYRLQDRCSTREFSHVPGRYYTKPNKETDAVDHLHK